MTWRDQLRQGSWRGVPFHTESAQGSGGRRAVVHEFPGRDVPYAEDLGRKGRAFTFDAYVLGPDYMALRDALLDVVEQAGPGILVHPYRGMQRVQLTEYSVKETTADGGYAKFSLTFVEAGRKDYPTGTVDTSAQVQAKAATAIAAMNRSFADEFTVDNKPGWVTSAASGVVDAALQQVEAIGALMPGVPAEAYDFARGLDSLSGSVSSLIRTPINLAGEISGLAGRLRTIVQQPADALAAYRALDGFGADLAPVSTATASRRTQAGNQTALTTLVRTAGAIGAAQAAAGLTYTSRDQALGVRDELGDRLDAVAELATATSYPTLMDLRAALVTDLTERGAALPRLHIWHFSRTLPALVAAHRIYGDASRETDLVARNDVRHPGFVPGGTALEALQ